MYRRQQLATLVLSPDWTYPPGEVMTAIQADVRGRPIFVHASNPAAAAKLDSTPGFSRLFANAAGAIYAFTSATSPR